MDTPAGTLWVFVKRGRRRTRCSRCGEPVEWAINAQTDRNILLNDDTVAGVTDTWPDTWEQVERIQTRDLHECPDRRVNPR